MKTQIAIIAGGLAIAAGVAYAELSPKSQPIPKTTLQQQTAPQNQQPTQTAPRQNTTSAPNKTRQKLINPNTQPQLPRGGGEGEGREGGEGGFFGGGDD